MTIKQKKHYYLESLIYSRIWIERVNVSLTTMDDGLMTRLTYSSEEDDHYDMHVGTHC